MEKYVNVREASKIAKKSISCLYQNVKDKKLKTIKKGKFRLFEVESLKKWSNDSIAPLDSGLLNNEYFVYFLGFLWADGYIPKNKNAVFLTIQEEDGKEMIKNIEFFNKSLDRPFTWKTRHPKYKRWKNMTHFYTSDKVLYNFMVQNNFHNKSKIMPIEILKKIPANLKNVFILGFFDGDGCISNGKNHCRSVSFSGPFDYDWNFIENLFKELGIRYKVSRKKRKKGANSSISTYNMFDIKKFGDYVYQTKVFSLPRKKEIYLKIDEAACFWIDRKKEILYNKKSKKFESRFFADEKIKNKIIQLGSYNTEEEAKMAIKVGKRVLQQFNIIS